ncbi:MAG: hypothetical protein IKW08_05005, partial [Roseburia sp.]|nr:hypothetical protein [Roseburia sp.]
NRPTAVLLCVVKGGGRLPQTEISAIFKVHMSLFLFAQFFIGHLTLPKYPAFASLLSIFNSLKFPIA